MVLNQTRMSIFVYTIWGTKVAKGTNVGPLGTIGTFLH